MRTQNILTAFILGSFFALLAGRQAWSQDWDKLDRHALEVEYEKSASQGDLGATLGTWGFYLDRAGSSLASDAYERLLFHPSSAVHSGHRSSALSYFAKKHDARVLRRYLQAQDGIASDSYRKTDAVEANGRDASPEYTQILRELSDHETYPFLLEKVLTQMVDRGLGSEAYPKLNELLLNQTAGLDSMRSYVVMQHYPHLSSAALGSVLKEDLAPTADMQWYDLFAVKAKIAEQIIRQGGRSDLVEALLDSVRKLQFWPIVPDTFSVQGKNVWVHLIRALALSLAKVQPGDVAPTILQNAGTLLGTRLTEFFSALGEAGLDSAWVRGSAGTLAMESSQDVLNGVMVSSNAKSVIIRQLGESVALVPYLDERLLWALMNQGLFHHPKRIMNAGYCDLKGCDEGLGAAPQISRQTFKEWIQPLRCYRDPDVENLTQVFLKTGVRKEQVLGVLEVVLRTQTAICLGEPTRESIAEFLLAMKVVPVSSVPGSKVPSIPTLEDAYSMMGDYFAVKEDVTVEDVPNGRIFGGGGEGIPFPRFAANFADHYESRTMEHGKWGGYLPITRIKKAVLRANDLRGPARLLIALQRRAVDTMAQASRAYMELGLLTASDLEKLRIEDRSLPEPCADDTALDALRFYSVTSSDAVSNCVVASSIQDYEATRAFETQNVEAKRDFAKVLQQEIFTKLVRHYQRWLEPLALSDRGQKWQKVAQYGALAAGVARETWSASVEKVPLILEDLRSLDLFGDAEAGSEQTRRVWDLIASSYFRKAGQSLSGDELVQSIVQEASPALQPILHDRLVEKLTLLREGIVTRLEANQLNQIMEREGDNDSLLLQMSDSLEDQALQGQVGTMRSIRMNYLLHKAETEFGQSLILSAGEMVLLTAVTAGVGTLVKGSLWIAGAADGAAAVARVGRVARALQFAQRFRASVGSAWAGLESSTILQGAELVPTALRTTLKLASGTARFGGRLLVHGVGRSGLIAGSGVFTFFANERSNLERMQSEAAVRYEAPIWAEREAIWNRLWQHHSSGSKEPQRFWITPAQRWELDTSIDSAINAQWALTAATCFLPFDLKLLSTAGLTASSAGAAILRTPLWIRDFGLPMGLRMGFRSMLPAALEMQGFRGFAIAENLLYTTSAGASVFGIPGTAFPGIAGSVQAKVEQLEQDLARGAVSRYSLQGGLLVALAEARQLGLTLEQLLIAKSQGEKQLQAITALQLEKLKLLLGATAKNIAILESQRQK